MNVDKLTCPVCGGGVKWACSADTGSAGTAHCQSGGMVSRMGSPDRPVCPWAGTLIVRVGDDVVVPLLVLDLRSGA